MELHVWRADLDDPHWPGPERLPAAERERAARLLRDETRKRWVASRWALRGVLARYLGAEPEEIELTEDDGGKPRLAGDKEAPRFNLSHSEAVALVAVCEGLEVGVDVERIEPGRNLAALAERALSPEDAEAVRNAPEADQPALFYQRWARHEARLKCLGVGLGGGPAPEAPVTAETLAIGDGYAAAVAVAGSELPLLRCWTFGPPLPGGG